MDSENVTALLHQIGQGDPDAWSQLLPLVYEELREIARRRIGNDQGATLGSTALVHEAFLRMVQPAPTFEDRKHFFAVAALAMRQILVDYARRSHAEKRGGGRPDLDLDDLEIGRMDRVEEILFVDQSIDRVRLIDERAARVVELRYFGGFSVEETAEILAIDPRTVKRDWRKARAFLSVLFDEAMGTPDDSP